jgi:peptidoglycan L-alanyl-D-glutamate endopeptidase CwlK
MDDISLKRLAEIYPELARRVVRMDAILAPQGVITRVVQSLRPYSVQMTLWRQGRDAAGNIIDKSKVVTNARPEQSWHTYGCAVDVAPFIGGVPDWNVAHPVWKLIEETGESLGMVSGAEWRTFPDAPHLQLTGNFPTTPGKEVHYLFAEGGLAAVWAEIDKALGIDKAA